MKSEEVLITPAMAKKCLDKNNLSNRNLSGSRVDAMVADMLSGNWHLTHQGIAFDDDGNLLDGQHRLAACVKSNVSFKSMVTRGMSKDACIAVDNTRPRSIVDHARQMGIPLTQSHAAIALVIEHGPEQQTHLSTNQRLGLIEKYSDAIAFSIRVSRAAVGFQSPCKAVIARAFYTQDHEKLSRFMDVYISVIAKDPSESAPIVLRKYLLGENNYGWKGRQAMYCKTETALDHFLQGNVISKLYGSEKELFPIPGEL
jgi:hypothetical protein